MAKLFRIISVVLFTVGLAHDLTINVDKLTDFTTKFDAVPSAMLQQGGAGSAAWFQEMMAVDLQAHGHLSMNAAKETFDMNIKFTATSAEPDAEATVRIVLDGPKSYAGLQVVAHGEEGQGNLDGCLKVTLPAGMLPPPEFVQQQIDQMKPMADPMANQFPHADLSYQGKDLALFLGCVAGCQDDYPGSPVVGGPSGDTGITIEHDGTPFGLFGSHGEVASPEELVDKIDDTTQPVVRFSDWTEGSQDIDEVTCGVGGQELLSRKHVQQALFVADHVLKNIKGATPLRALYSDIFTQVPQMLRSAAAPREVQTLADAPGSAMGFGTLAMATAAAAMGALAVLAAARVFGPGQRRVATTPMLG